MNNEIEKEDNSDEENSSEKSTEKISEESSKTSKTFKILDDCKIFISSLSDATKFSYCGYCATTLHSLFGTEDDR